MNEQPIDNQAALAAAIEALIGGLRCHQRDGSRMERLPGCPSLDALAETFGLSPFEQALLLMCAAIELDGRTSEACAEAAGRIEATYPTFALALATLPDPHWSAIGPESPLRRWRLLDMTGTVDLPLSTRPLVIDERTLNFLIGVQQPSTQLHGVFVQVPADGPDVPSHRAVVSRIVAAWSRTASAPPVTLITGNDDGSRRAIAAAAAAELGFGLAAMTADALPTTPAERATLARLWERESALSNVLLYLDCEDFDGQQHTIARFIDTISSPLFVGIADPVRGIRRPRMTIVVNRPTSAEQRDLWRTTLGLSGIHLNGKVDQLAAQFDLSGGAIRASISEALASGDASDGIESSLWDAGRSQARVRLDDLAERIESSASWDDLVLPADAMASLHELVRQIQLRTTVYETWGFGATGQRGLGVSALFAGPSGTGKTLAAEVLANELRLDVYRIDLSGVVSKYIGETEKNLRRVFDAAEEGGAVLFFDEADALFGKRSEVKDSHDRYANIEVNYLLQRMESYRGLAILATNLKGSLDSAFMRRIRFVISFPVPDRDQRAEIWRRIFPAAAPVADLDPDLLAGLSLTGGNIRNIAVNAAFLAAAGDGPIRLRHVALATRSEFTKLERPQPDDIIRDWIGGEAP